MALQTGSCSIDDGPAHPRCGPCAHQKPKVVQESAHVVDIEGSRV